MSLSQEGLKVKVKSTHIHVQVKKSDSLVILCNSIDWEKVMNLAIEDLKSSTKKAYWWLGRKLFLRVHFAVFFLQALLKMTDRETEQRIVDSPRLQVFCGRGIIKSWKCPDHTKIEEFRNRLSPDTQKNLCHYILRLAANLKYVDPKDVDIDSTIQEANMAYPSDASLMKKLSLKCHNVLKFMKDSGKKYLPTYLNIDIEKIVKKARGYFFLAKNTAIERKREIFKEHHALVKKEVYPILNFLENLSPQAISALPWNQKKRVMELKSMGKKT